MAENITTKRALEKLEAQLECSVCFDDFKQPKLLPCFHVFCKSPCLENLVAEDGHSLTCPTCRHIVPLSEKGVDGLQSDFHIDRLIEVRDAFNKAAEPTETHCGNCGDGKATGFCRDCEDFLCEECQGAHKKMRKLKGHKLLSLEEYQSQSISIVPPKALQNCPKHPQNVLKIYCETCSTLICNDCTVRLHKDHNYDLATDVFHKHKEGLVYSLKPVKEKLEEVHQTLNAFDTRAKEINDQRAILEAQIHEELDQEQQLFDKRRAQLVGELDMLTQQKLKTLAAQKDQVEITQMKLTSCLEYAEGSLQTATENEILAMKAPVLKRIEQISSELRQDIIQPKIKADMELITDTKVQFEQACTQLFNIAEVKIFRTENSYTTGVSEIATVGEQKTVVFHAVSQENEGYRGKLNLKAELKHIKSDNGVQCEVVQQRNGQHEISYQPVHKGKHELHLTVNGDPVQGSPFPIAITPSAQSLNKPVRVIQGLDHPRNVTINSKQQIVVTDGDGTCVSLLTPDGEKIKTLGTKGSEVGQLHNAFGVTVDKDDNIYVVGCDNHRIQKFSLEGKFLATVGYVGYLYQQFHSPVGIAYNHKDNYLYIADQCNHQIQVLNTDLTLVRSFGANGSKDGQFDLPFNIAFDDANNLYVTDHHNDRVQVLTTQGQFLRAFSRKANGKKLSRPWAIAIDSSNTVYVSENGPYSVSVFTSQGDYITTFGGAGSEGGQSQMIYGLCIDGNDTIITSDLKNGRLQFY